MPQKKFLECYASQLGAVEIDYTFSRMPSRKTLDGWREATPRTFRLALKASRRITHFGRRKIPYESLDYLLAVVPALVERLGILLFQLPPNFKCDIERPKSSWAPCRTRFHTPSSSGTISRLTKRSIPCSANMTWQFAFTPPPITLTASRIYVRLRKSGYSLGERLDWQGRFKGWARDGIDVYAFIKHEDKRDAPRIAMEFVTGVV